jgi:hypothetical protein
MTPSSSLSIPVSRLILKTEMAEGESAAVIGPTRLPASRVASSYRCNRCEPERLVEPSTTPSSSLSIPVSRLILKTEMAEGESAVVIGPTRLPASRVASSYRAGCTTSLPLRPLRSPDQNDNLFENRPRAGYENAKARCRFDSGLFDFFATEATALSGSD